MAVLLLDLAEGRLHVLAVLGLCLHGVGVGLGGAWASAREVLKRGAGGTALAGRAVVNKVLKTEFNDI